MRHWATFAAATDSPSIPPIGVFPPVLPIDREYTRISHRAPVPSSAKETPSETMQAMSPPPSFPVFLVMCMVGFREPCISPRYQIGGTSFRPPRSLHGNIPCLECPSMTQTKRLICWWFRLVLLSPRMPRLIHRAYCGVFGYFLHGEFCRVFHVDYVFGGFHCDLGDGVRRAGGRN